RAPHLEPVAHAPMNGVGVQLAAELPFVLQAPADPALAALNPGERQANLERPLGPLDSLNRHRTVRVIAKANRRVALRRTEVVDLCGTQRTLECPAAARRHRLQPQAKTEVAAHVTRLVLVDLDTSFVTAVFHNAVAGNVEPRQAEQRFEGRSRALTHS